MKNFKFLFLIISCYGFSQFDYGVKANLNFNASGEIKNLSQDFEAIENATDNSSRYFFGFYGEVKLTTFYYLRPELQFTQFKKNSNSLEYRQSKIEAPISVGYKPLPFMSVFTGPSFQYIMNQDSDAYQLGELDKKLTMGLHFGTRFELLPLGIALRYERGLTTNDIKLLNIAGVNSTERLIDTRPSLWIVELSFSLNQLSESK